MRRAVGILAIATLACGCASRQPEPTVVVAEPRPAPVAAAALAFTPRVALDARPLDLARDGRDPAAFLGYDAATVSYLYVRQDDRLRSGGYGFGDDYGFGGRSRFERRAISETFSSRVR